MPSDVDPYDKFVDRRDDILLRHGVEPKARTLAEFEQERAENVAAAIRRGDRFEWGGLECPNVSAGRCVLGIRCECVKQAILRASKS